mgnify:CR=1 FL=1
MKPCEVEVFRPSTQAKADELIDSVPSVECLLASHRLHNSKTDDELRAIAVCYDKAEDLDRTTRLVIVVPEGCLPPKDMVRVDPGCVRLELNKLQTQRRR